MTEPAPRCRDGRCVRMRPGLCGPCADRVAGWLAELPALVARVANPDRAVCCDAHAGQPLSAGAVPCPNTGARVSGSSSTPLPGGADRLSWLGMAGQVSHAAADCPACSHWAPVGPNLPCLDAEQQTGAVPVGPALASWAGLIAELLNVTPPRAGRIVEGRLGPVARTTAADVPALVAFLIRWHDTIAREPWSDEYAQEIHGQWRTAMTLSGAWDGRPEHMTGVPCPKCDLAAMYRFPGSDGRRCDPRAGGCDWWMPDDDYDRWVRLLAHWTKEAKAMNG